MPKWPRLVILVFGLHQLVYICTCRGKPVEYSQQAIHHLNGYALRLAVVLSRVIANWAAGAITNIPVSTTIGNDSFDAAFI